MMAHLGNLLNRPKDERPPGPDFSASVAYLGPAGCSMGWQMWRGRPRDWLWRKNSTSPPAVGRLLSH